MCRRWKDVTHHHQHTSTKATLTDFKYAMSPITFIATIIWHRLSSSHMHRWPQRPWQPWRWRTAKWTGGRKWQWVLRCIPPLFKLNRLLTGPSRAISKSNYNYRTEAMQLPVSSPMHQMVPTSMPTTMTSPLPMRSHPFPVCLQNLFLCLWSLSDNPWITFLLANCKTSASVCDTVDMQGFNHCWLERDCWWAAESLCSLVHS